MPMDFSEQTKVPIGVNGCNPPHVPTRTILRDVSCGFISRVLKSMLAKASSSFITMSMLSQPMPVESTVMRQPL